METEVAMLIGAEGRIKEALAGRNKGPQFVVKSALGDNDGGTRRTTAVSRAWRRSARWLTVLTGQPTEQQRRAAISRLRHYKHPAPRVGGATSQQEKGFASFEAWRTLLTDQALQLSIWAEVLPNWAVKNA